MRIQYLKELFYNQFFSNHIISAFYTNEIMSAAPAIHWYVCGRTCNNRSNQLSGHVINRDPIIIRIRLYGKRSIFFNDYRINRYSLFLLFRTSSSFTEQIAISSYPSPLKSNNKGMSFLVPNCIFVIS